MLFKIDHLKHIPLFSDLTESELRFINDHSHIVKYPARNIIFYEGDPGGCLYVILSGTVRIALLGEEGKQVILGHIGKSDFFGVLSLLDNGPRCSTAISLEKTILLQLSQEVVHELLQKHLAMYKKVLCRVGKWLRLADGQIKSMGMYDIYGRIVYGLLKFQDRPDLGVNGQILIAPRPSIQELADRIGSSRETVSRGLKVLKQNNYVIETDSSYVIQSRVLSLYPNLVKDFRMSRPAMAS